MHDDRFQIFVYAPTGRWTPALIDPRVPHTDDNWILGDVQAALLAALQAVATGAPRVVLRDAEDATHLVGEHGTVTHPAEYVHAQADLGLDHMIAAFEHLVGARLGRSPSPRRHDLIYLRYDDGRPEELVSRHDLQARFDDRANGGMCPEEWQEALWAALDQPGGSFTSAGVTYTTETVHERALNQARRGPIISR